MIPLNQEKDDQKIKVKRKMMRWKWDLPRY